MGDDADATKTQLDAPRVAAPRRREADSSPPLLNPGTMVDHFRVMRRVGHGGMGEVYLARDTKLGRRVALKMVHASLLGSEEAVRRFEGEARAMARLNHPNILTIHAVGDHAGYPYVALEYVEGETLAARIRGRGSLGVAEALRIGLAIAQGLEDAHRHGVVHRDLKPGNILVGSDGRIRLLDFGLATIADVDAPALKKGFQGTPPYMAPERWGGELGTAATDVWSFGALLFRLLAGRVPYPQRDLSELGAAVLLGEPPELEGEDLPAPLRLLVSRCLSGSAEARPSSAELVTTLRDLLLEGHRARAPEESPFRGLLAFRERHSDVFFGRDTDVAAIVERLRNEPVVAVVGPSGAGKSSLVEAGVIPRLREQQRWTVIRIRPGGAPMRALATSLMRAESSDGGVSATPTSPTATERDGGRTTELETELEAQTPGAGVRVRRIAEETGTRVLLFVDQLEELFTLAEPEDAAHFLRVLTSAADDPQEPVRFVYTVRDDFLGRIPVSDAASALSAVHPLARPEPAALLDILTRPLELAGYRYEDDELPREMVREVQEEPACLPLLEFTAQMLWEHRDRDEKKLLRAEYERLGGVEGALARHADGVLAGLSAAELNLAREILLRLVTPQRTRRIATRTQALSGLGDAAGRVLGRLTDARLVQTSRSRESDDATLELAHESLVNTWNTLSEWIDASGEELEFLAEVTQVAELWARRGRRDAELWEGQALSDALRARGRCATTVPQMVDQFLDAGRKRERRRTWQKRAIALVGVAVLAIVAVVMAVQKRQADALRARAEEQRSRAEGQRAEALREGARSALARGAVLEARAKLRTAMEAQDSTMGRGLFWVLADEPLVWQSDTDLSAYRVAYAPDGHTIVASRMSGPAYLVDADTGAIRTLRGLDGSAFAVAFSRDGALVAAGSLTGDARVWRRETGELLSGLMSHRGIVFDVAFDPSSERLATAAADGLRIWRLGETPEARVLGDDSTQVRSVDFTRGGELLAAGDDAGKIHLYDPETGERTRTLSGHEGNVLSVRFSPRGGLLASSGSDNSVRLWDLETGEPTAVLSGHRARVSEVAFSGDGQLLVSASHDGSIGLWDPERGALVERRELGAGAVRGVGFAAEGRRLAISSLGTPVRVFDLAIAPPPENAGHDGNVLEVAISPDGATIASAGADGAVLLFDAPSGTVKARLPGHRPAQVSSVTFTPDGSELVTLGNEGSIRIWEARTGTLIREATVSGVEPYGELAVSPDGSMVAVPLEAGQLRLYDLTTTQLLRQLDGLEAMGGIAFSPSGRLLAASSTHGPVLSWDLGRSAGARPLAGHAGGSEDVVFTDDESFVTGGQDRMVRLWRVGSEESEVVLEHEGIVYGVSVAAGGWIASASADGTARVRRLGTDRIRVLPHPKEVNTVALSHDGSLVVTGSDGGVVRAWHVETGELAWRAPVMLGSPGRLATHMGWRDLASDEIVTLEAEWARAALAAERGSARDSLLCLVGDGHLDAWNVSSDTRMWTRETEAVDDVAALSEACATLASGVVHVADEESAHEVTPGGAEALAIAVSPEGALFGATADGVFEIPTDGGDVREVFVLDGTGLTALTVDDARLAVGYRDGNFEVHGLTGDESGPTFERTPPSPVTRMVLGPSRTVIVGFADGTLGIWGPSGALLRRTRLHGSTAHLVLDGSRLHAASVLGRYVSWNLEAFHEERCEVLRAVWAQIPVVWESGRAVVREPDPHHACR